MTAHLGSSVPLWLYYIWICRSRKCVKILCGLVCVCVCLLQTERLWSNLCDECVWHVSVWLSFLSHNSLSWSANKLTHTNKAKENFLLSTCVSNRMKRKERRASEWVSFMIFFFWFYSFCVVSDASRMRRWKISTDIKYSARIASVDENRPRNTLKWFNSSKMRTQ